LSFGKERKENNVGVHHKRRERKREDGKKTEEVERRKERWRQRGGVGGEHGFTSDTY